jgi:hypothetical protein
MEATFIVKAIAFLLAVVGALCVIAGIFVGGSLIFLSGYGLTTIDYEDEIN